MMIDIKDIKGNIKASVKVTAKSLYHKEIMSEEYVLLSFNSDRLLNLTCGDYIDCEFGRFYIVDIDKPVSGSSGGYTYEQKFNAGWERWSKFMLFYDRQKGYEKAWKLTSFVENFMEIIVSNLKKTGFGTFTYTVDSTVSHVMKLVEFDGTDIVSALTKIAETWDTEWWITDDIIHIGHCILGTPIDIRKGDIVTDLQASDSQDTNYITRLYAFGSTRNLPKDYRKNEEGGLVIEGVVENRLKLPEGIDHVDAWENMPEKDIVEGVALFDNVYPHRIGTISTVSTKEYTDTVENEDGSTTSTKWNAYRFADTSITFSDNYRIEGQDLHIIFQTGSLAGMDFAVSFNPDKVSEDNPKSQIWEIIRNDSYGINLPNDVMKPNVGDTYVLYGYDTKFVSDTLVPEAEQELLKQAKELVKKESEDKSVYEMPSNPVRCAGYRKVDGKLIYNVSDVIDLDIGQAVTLYNEVYFKGGSRTTRIRAFEKHLDNKYNCIYTAGEASSYSRSKELEQKVGELTYQSNSFVSGGGSPIYVIKRYDQTTPSDYNVFSALKTLATCLRKDKDDTASNIIKFLRIQKFFGGADFGEFVSGMSYGKGGNIDALGNGELESLKVRSYLEVLEIIFNRLNAQEGDTTFTDSGSIETVVKESDGSYTLYLHKRWENDITSFQEGDVVRGVVNNLASGSGEYHTAWFRVLSIDRPANKLSVVMYPDAEVPAKKNFPPDPLMNIVRWGNAKENSDGTYNIRQSTWYISSNEGRIVYLQHVTKPIIDDGNYALTLGLPPQLQALQGKAINWQQPYVFARGIIYQDLMRIDYQGHVVKQERFRGTWSLGTAKSDNPYVNTDTSVDVVYWNGCKWQCLKSGTLQEPRYAATDWQVIEYNDNFKIDLQNPDNWSIDYAQIDDPSFQTVITVTASIYNEDITDKVQDSDITWTRDTGNITEDNAWAVKRKDDGKTLILKKEDFGIGYRKLTKCSFTCSALLRDGEQEIPAKPVSIIF